MSPFTMASSRNLPFLVFSTLLIIILQLNFAAAQTTMKGGYWFPEGSEIQASDIDSSLFTHLYFAFADLDPNTSQVVPSPNAPISDFSQIVQQKNPSVKTLLSIGGGGGDPPKREAFSAMASQQSTRKTFIDSSIKLARDNNFHGLDLDWEHPESNTDRDNLELLLNEWRSAVAGESTTSGQPALLLSAAVAGSSYISPLNFYPTQAIINNLDWINLMAYDFYIPTNPEFQSSTYPPAPLLNPPRSNGGGDAGVKEWIAKGVPASKLAFGLPFYGYAWTLQDANNHGLFAPANGPAITEDGARQYRQIITDFVSKGAPVEFNSSVVTNFCYSGTTWIGYDDSQSIAAKVDYAKDQKLLGYFAWHVGADNGDLSRNGEFNAR